MPRNPRGPAAASADAEAGAARLRGARRGRTRPTGIARGAVESNEQVVGQDKPRDMKSTGAARKALEPSHIEPVDKPVSKEKLADLAFMEEELTIQVHDSTNPTDEPIPYVINGGRRQAFIRGREQKVKRKFVEILARMKKTTYTQEKYKDAQGIDGIRNVPHTALVYPFAVVHDPNPRGRDWLKGVLAEA